MIRFILVILVIIVLLIGSIPILLFEWLLNKISPSLRNKSCLALLKGVFGLLIFLCGTKTVFLGEENIPKDTAVLYVGNHRSFFDIILTYPRVPRPTGYIAKKEIGKVPLLNLWMKNVNCLFLDRHDLKQGMKTILAAIENVKSGISMAIFPEGTRNTDPDTLLPFHEGSFKIAQKGKVPIIPMTIVNSPAVFEDHFPYIKRATVVIEYGKPIYIDQLEKEDQKKVGSYVREIMLATYQKNKQTYFG